ncbi:hypothetical protein PGT21_006600 [Puccinia graminis f. sp. tritici]|uniref:Uncharacterized protein n=1 Tax=Puccinia graminis f. sp. tritici TaxID=56615 RepID=A0A5B0LKV2_PUCGR|nr:hypothetical protein PGT21_006495 [Puccinia graminis f. sp. tritici]KAA1064524.1 hypothetical protein PGT21_006600 [Puccinia graminis f. sp. tritici]
MLACLSLLILVGHSLQGIPSHGYIQIPQTAPDLEADGQVNTFQHQINSIHEGLHNKPHSSHNRLHTISEEEDIYGALKSPNSSHDESIQEKKYCIGCLSLIPCDNQSMPVNIRHYQGGRDRQLKQDYRCPTCGMIVDPKKVLEIQEAEANSLDVLEVPQDMSRKEVIETVRNCSLGVLIGLALIISLLKFG